MSGGIAEVARRAGVSISTVSYVMSGKRSVSNTTRVKVMKAARDLHYRGMHNVGDARDARQETKIVAVSAPMHPTVNYSAYSQFLLAVTHDLNQYGYDTLLFTEEHAEEHIARACDTDSVDGLVLLDVLDRDPRVELALTLRVPAISIGLSGRRSGMAVADLNFAEMGRMAVGRAVAAGHEHAVLLCGDDGRNQGASCWLRLYESIEHEAWHRGMKLTVLDSRDGIGMDDGAMLVRRILDADPYTSMVFGRVERPVLTQLGRELIHGRYLSESMSFISLGACSGAASGYPFPVDELPMRPNEVCATAVNMLAGMMRGNAPSQRVQLVSPVYINHGGVIRRRQVHV